MEALLAARAILVPVQGCSEGPGAVRLVVGGVSCSEPKKG